MKLQTALLLLGVVVRLPSQGSAQVAELRPAPSVLFRAEPGRPLVVDFLNVAPTYWKEGALIGGLGGATFGILLTLGWCDYGDNGCNTGNVVGGIVVLAVSGAIHGAQIGGLFPKSE